jgi:GntR family transcriptional regulator, transcriptional repressor for pyruvate dehydrogenase complex
MASPKTKSTMDVKRIQHLPMGISIVAPIEVQGFERVSAFFKEQLASGELRPGQRLLPERELAQKLGVSRPTLREVMRALTLLGAIEIRPGQGAFVTAPNLGVLREFFSVLLSMQPSLYEHVLEARVAIERQAARLACKHAQISDVDRLEAALLKIEKTVSDENAGSEADFEFHNALVRASHNEVLLFIHEAVQGLLRRSHLERRQAVLEMPGFLATLGRAHRMIVDAIISRDPDRAEEVVRAHLTIAQDYKAASARRPPPKKARLRKPST